MQSGISHRKEFEHALSLRIVIHHYSTVTGPAKGSDGVMSQQVSKPMGHALSHRSQVQYLFSEYYFSTIE